ncbi:MAG: trigger factor [Synergistales bacterium]|nr:trigger factor [Synergistales bacterium]
MRSEIISQESNQIRLHAEIPADQFQRAVESTVRELSQKANIKGFRKGHIPRKVLEMNYGKQAIYNEALEKVVPQAVQQLVEEYELVLLEEPSFDFKEVTEGEPLSFDIDFEVRPEITLPALEDISVTKPGVSITEEDIDQAIERLLQNAAEGKTVEGKAAEENDTVVVSYTPAEAGEEAEGQTAPIQLNSPQLRQEVRDALIGTSAGDEVLVELDGTEDGQEPKYRFTVNEVQEEIVPELNETTIQQLTNNEASTEAELRELVARKLHEESERRTMESARNEAFEILTERAEIDSIPENKVEQQRKQLEENEKNRLKNEGGMTLEQYLEQKGQSREEYEADLQTNAEAQVRNGFIMDALADSLDIEVLQDDIDSALHGMARRNGLELKKVYEAYRDNEQMLRELVHKLRMHKTMDKVMEVVDIEETPPEEAHSGEEES